MLPSGKSVLFRQRIQYFHGQLSLKGFSELWQATIGSTIAPSMVHMLADFAAPTPVFNVICALTR